MTPVVLTVGDVVTDISVRPSTTVVVDSDTPAQIICTTGGGGANVASWLAHSGMQARLCARVGDDPWGVQHRGVLAARGVDVRATVDASAPTGTVVVIIDGQRRTMFPDRGANACLEGTDLTAAVLDGVTHVHLSGYMLLDDRSRPAALEVLRSARSAGCTTSVDASSAGPLRTVGAEDVLAWTRGVGICHANLDEAAALTGTSEPGEAAQRLGGHYGEAVVTTGDGPAAWSDGTTVVHRATAAVAVVDPTGAGDAFTAGFLAARLTGVAPDGALAAGHRAGSEAIVARGAQPTAPDRTGGGTVEDPHGDAVDTG